MYGIGLIVLFGFKNYNYIFSIFTNLYIHIRLLNNKFYKTKTNHKQIKIKD